MEGVKTTKLPKVNCPYCEHHLDAASDMETNAVPTPGDVTICISCASVLVFDEALKPRKPTPEEYQAIKRMPNVLRHQKAIRLLDRRAKA